MFWWWAVGRCWLQVRGLYFCGCCWRWCCLPCRCPFVGWTEQVVQLLLQRRTGYPPGDASPSGPDAGPQTAGATPPIFTVISGHAHGRPNSPRIRSLPRTARKPKPSCAVRALRFCTATRPTHQLLGDELDGSRPHLPSSAGAEGAEPHAPRRCTDWCLTCRNRESTCPSGAVMATWWTLAARSWTKKCLQSRRREGIAAGTEGRTASPLFAPS